MITTDNLLSKLNPPQREAVEQTEGPLLVLAGAGSGKTRVITYRIAHLLSLGVQPQNILAVTFTNKAAGEMAKRIGALAGRRGQMVWVSTFHSFCARFLRNEIEKIGGNKNFVIYDDHDQKNLIKQGLEQQGVDDNKFKPAVILEAISRAKDDLLDAASYRIYALANNDPFRQLVAELYLGYEKKLRQSNALDFGDLLMKTVQILKEKKEVLEMYQQRFQYLLIDEYQDTNQAQYILTKYLAASHKNICVVGDDDQSIYSWRGANIRNILEFEKDYHHVKVVKLEQNYRSTATILETAWKVIANNRYRKEKKLWTENPPGEKIDWLELPSGEDEANYIAGEIERLSLATKSYSSFAIFYRTNAQSRFLEESLRRCRIPYQIVGNVRFYDRAEIKDILCYLRVLVNPDDSLSLKRIINLPARGISKITVEFLEKISLAENISLFQVISQIPLNPPLLKGEEELPSWEKIKFLTPKAVKALINFRQMINSFGSAKTELTVKEVTKLILETTGYKRRLEEEKSADSQDRLQNIDELISAMTEFEERSEDKSLLAFLEQIALVSSIDTWEESKDYVTLMTLHLAKGLEFPVVFITGLEEGLFPHGESNYSPADLEEERRLCYVGMTRAKEKLYLTSTASRRLYGQIRWNLPSRFIAEAGISTEESRGENSGEGLRFDPARKESVEQNAEDSFKIGQRVEHEKFGQGKIIDSSGCGDDLKVVVMFSNGQWKKLLVKYANLRKI
ncbi:MAG: UvrD-helicase domain-containing protein [Elusimicrobiota bacterium]